MPTTGGKKITMTQKDGTVTVYHVAQADVGTITDHESYIKFHGTKGAEGTAADYEVSRPSSGGEIKIEDE